MSMILKTFLLISILLVYSKAESNLNESRINQTLLSYINNIRTTGASCGAATKPLRWNSSLQEAAKAHARDIGINNFVGHMGSGTLYDDVGRALGKPSTFIDRIKYFGFPFPPKVLIGEIISKVTMKYKSKNNLMISFNRAIKNWLKDPPHCRLIMNKRFTDGAIAYYKRNEEYFFIINLGEVK